MTVRNLEGILQTDLTGCDTGTLHTVHSSAGSRTLKSARKAYGDAQEEYSFGVAVRIAYLFPAHVFDSRSTTIQHAKVSILKPLPYTFGEDSIRCVSAAQ